MRHGESVWNLENKFTGWFDVALSEKGHQEAIEGGKLVHDAGLKFDLAFTSTLKRAIRTCVHPRSPSTDDHVAGWITPWSRRTTCGFR